MSETVVTPTTPAPEVENNTIREMRAAIDAAKAEAKANAERASAAEAKIQEAERAKLDEIERVKLEKADLEKKVAELSPLQDKLTTFETKAQAEYEAELSTIPEDKRELVRSLSHKGTALDSLEALRAAKALLPAPAAATGGRPAPNAPGVNPPAQTFDPKNPFANAFKS